MRKPTNSTDKKTKLPATDKPKSGEWLPGKSDTTQGNILDKLNGEKLVEVVVQGVKAYIAHNELQIVKEQTKQKESDERVAFKMYDVEDNKSELEHTEEMQKLLNQDKQSEMDHAARMEYLSQQGKALEAQIERDHKLLDNLLADKLTVNDYLSIKSQDKD